MPPPPKKHSKGSHSGSRHRHTLSLQKTEVMINIYDLLPPGKISSIMWAMGSSLLHSGVVINGKEYAYGGHDKRGMSGVYWTKPKSEPPGGTFRCELLQGFTVAPPEEIESIVKAASEEFQGTSYNILTRNCNHFTSYLCEKLTGRPGPNWLNRAASIGIALPCVVPKEWIAPPDFDTADGELVEDDEDGTTESSRMLPTRQHRRSLSDAARIGETYDEEWESDRQSRTSRKGKGKGPLRDTSGRVVPPSERAPSR